MNIYNNAKYFLSKASFLSYPRHVVVGQRHMGKYPIHIISECYETTQVKRYKQAHLVLLDLYVGSPSLFALCAERSFQIIAD